MDWASRPEVLAIISRSPAITQPVCTLCKDDGPAGRPVGLRSSEELPHASRLRGAGHRNGELPAPRSGPEALRLVHGLAWPGDGSLLAQAFALLAHAQTESLIVTLHDPSGRYICAIQRQGGHAGIELNYRDLIESALVNRAGGMLLIHNHPSGDPTPSKDDITATRSLAALCRPLKLVLHDHIIVGATAITSMRRAGLIVSEPRAAA